MNGSDGSTTFTDSNDVGRTFTAVGNAQIDTAQYKFGGASGLFDGTGDYLTAPNSADFNFGSGDFTIEAWVRLNATGQFHVVVNQSAGSSRGWILDVTSGDKLRLYGYITSWQELGISTTSLSTGAWYHCAATREGTSFRVFLDGVLEDTTVISGAIVAENSNLLHVGHYLLASGAHRYMNGWIDDLRITKGVARYTGNFTAPTAAFGSGAAAWPSPPYIIDFLVIAGGAGGGQLAANELGGGGGAGGYRNSHGTSGANSAAETAYVGSRGVVITVTVGGGGAADTNGTNTTISGTGYTTITSTGGGYGGQYQGSDNGTVGQAGGSGGGAGATDTTSLAGGAGTANQGLAGGVSNANSVSESVWRAGGGGGAGVIGGSGEAGIPVGGAGLSSTITGAAVSRAGGGGGGQHKSSQAVGGAGGGGAGNSANSGNGVAGTANTGGGGGGPGYASGVAGAGGSGVVILRMPTEHYSGTTAGSPGVTTDGSLTILTYNSSGNYTA
jgi:hypothetical protein